MMATVISSPSTSLSSAISSPASFHTANASGGDVSFSTSASSPVRSRASPYRDTRLLPLELKQHCQILLEEQLYMPAINLLSSVLGATVHKTNKPVTVPPPSHLALLSTLVVHPIYTTRADKPESRSVATLSLSYLRSLLKVAGPLNADFRTAVQFHSLQRYNRRGGHHSTGNNSDASDSESDRETDRLRGKMSNDSSLWHRTSDFWSVVGWAFKCATLHPSRWQHWRAWLEFMIELLDADWTERTRIDEADDEMKGKPEQCATASRKESIIALYLRDISNRQGYRNLMKALFPSGDAKSFPEIFDKELRGPKASSNKRKRDTGLDLANDSFGDYFDNESMSSGVSEPPTPQKPRDIRDSSNAASNPGVIESIDLRLRLFSIMSAAVHTLRRDSELADLYEIFAGEVQTLPLEMFSLIVTQRSNPLLTETHVSLTNDMFRLLLDKIPRRAQLDFSMETMRKYYVCQAADTTAVEDNAKLSLLVESALQLFWTSDRLEYSAELDEAVHKGINARAARLKKKRAAKMKTQPEEKMAHDVLTRSGERILALMEALRCVSSSEVDS